jgi:hypothetical protein
MVQSIKKTVNVDDSALEKLSAFAKSNKCKNYEILEELIWLLGEKDVSERVSTRIALKNELKQKMKALTSEQISELLKQNPTQL